MRERDIHRKVEEQNPEEKRALYEKLKVRLNLPDTQPQAKPGRMKKSWIVSLATACVCVLCIAVVLPIVLINGSNRDRYCQIANCQEINLGSTLKEYSEQNNKNLLYVHWYDIAEEVQTYRYVNINDSTDVVLLKETIANGETGLILQLSITKINTHVQEYEFFYDVCTNEYTLKNVKIYWRTGDQSLAMFEYQGYRYYLEIDEPNGGTLIKEIVKEMLG